MLNAIVLAAGLGTRLRPITGSIPKPMVPICNTPLLDIVLSKLRNFGVERIAVNTHYLADVVSGFINQSPHAEYTEIFHEPEILGTGGPLVNAKRLLSNGDVFILHNGDVLTDLNLERLIDFHRNNGFTATFALVDGPESMCYRLYYGHVIDILDTIDFNEENTKKYTYTGIMAFSASIFKYLPKKPENCSIIKAIAHAINAEPGTIGGCVYENVYWNDLGTMKQFFQAHEDILLKRLISIPGITPADSSTVYGENTVIASDADISGFLCTGRNCVIGEGATLCKCVLLDDARVAPGDFRYNEVIGPSFSRHRECQSLKSLQLISDIDLDNAVVSSLVEQGSDRGFFRIKTSDSSKVLMRSSQMDEDFDRYISIGEFLHGTGLQTPRIFSYSRQEYAILMEDLGNSIIYKKISGRENTDLFNDIYGRIVDALALFQTRGTLAVKARGNDLGIRIFSYDYLRWETSYFMKNFLENFCGLSALESELGNEFDLLAGEVFSQPKIFMHRDFQSQNILEHEGRIRFVDFQGARLGPLAYDIMSLLRDPYINISIPQKNELLNLYFTKFLEYGGTEASGMCESDRSLFCQYAVTAGLQRSMQALGAYAFLSLRKGKAVYMKFIPQGYKYLMEGLENFGKSSYPFRLDRLTRLCASVEKTLKEKLR